MAKAWLYKEPDREKVGALCSALGISPLLASLLLSRGAADAGTAEAFLYPDLSRLHNPFLLPDMEKAVLRTRAAIDLNEKIVVYGDRDVDGVTATAVLVRTLKNLGADVVWALPCGQDYGVQKPVLQRAAADGARLVITVDCGTKAVDEIRFARGLGLDVIVTDHHLPGELLPEACAIVNPSLPCSAYPRKDLAGCLTAFKFAAALMFSFNRCFNQDFVVIDLETTGLSPHADGILEVGALLLRNFIPVSQFHSLVQPPRPVPPAATRIHGITDAMVADAPPIRDVLPRLAAWIGSRTVVAHNARFDLGFLGCAYRRHLGKDFSNAFIDTLALARENFELPGYSLSELVRSLRISRVNTHRALDDCFATAELFQRIEEKRDPRLQFFIEDQLDLAALGTLADVVPLVHENRVVVSHGLKRLASSRKVGLRALLASSGWSAAAGKPPTARDVSWNVTPVLNAAGRFSQPDLACRLLLTENEREARELVRALQDLNQDRRQLQKKNLAKFTELAREQCDLENDKILFVVAPQAEHGVTGIVASRMVQEYARPVVLLIQENGTARGSSRSIPGFNVVEALAACAELLDQYGGHPAACGLTVPARNIAALRERLKRIGEERLGGADFSPPIVIDACLRAEDFEPRLWKDAARLEPYGPGNPDPVFALFNVRLEGAQRMGKGHLKVRVLSGDKRVEAVGWGMGELADALDPSLHFDLAFQVGRDPGGGPAGERVVLLDLCPSGSRGLGPAIPSFWDGDQLVLGGI